MLIKKRYIFSTLITLILSSAAAIAGDLSPTMGPENTSSYTLQDICDRLDSGEEGTQQNFTEPGSGPSPTGCTLNEVMEKAPAVTGDAAEPDDVATGTKYWGLTNGNWGIKTGTGTGGGGVECSTGTDRFTDNNDGTVTDTCTKLIWLQNANCPNDKRNWDDAKQFANTLHSGDCGLTDGSSEDDWHLPSIDELQSLIDYSQYDPALPDGHPFSGVQSSYYWSATTTVASTSYAWYVNLNTGHVGTNVKTSTDYVWPVRSRH